MTQYVDSGTLQDRIKAGLLDFDLIVNIARQICKALRFAHKKGIVHRDVKPANILIAEGEWVLLADFGLAKMLDLSAQITQSQSFVGTPYYMSPEQIQEDEIDERSDIYSLGAVLYEMLTGRCVFTGGIVDVLHAHLYQPPLLPSLFRPDVPVALTNVVLCALAKQPDERYQTIAAVEKALPGGEFEN